MVERLHIPVQLCARCAEAGPNRQPLVLQVLVHSVLVPPGCCIHQRLALRSTCPIAQLLGQPQEHLAMAENSRSPTD